MLYWIKSIHESLVSHNTHSAVKIQENVNQHQLTSVCLFVVRLLPLSRSYSKYFGEIHANRVTDKHSHR